MAPFRSTEWMSILSTAVAWWIIVRSFLWAHALNPVEVPDPDNFIRRTRHAVAVAGDYLYIEGGTVNQYVKAANGSRLPALAASNVTLSLSLHESWSKDSVEFKEIPRRDKPIVVGPRLRVGKKDDKYQIYQWQGSDVLVDSSHPLTDFSPIDDDPKLWIMTPYGEGTGTWRFEEPEDSKWVNKIRRALDTTDAVCGDTPYSLGGAVSYSTDSRIPEEKDSYGRPLFAPAPGMVNFNMTSGEWHNQSVAEIFPPQGTHLLGTATCVTGFGDTTSFLPIGRQVTEPTIESSSVEFFDLGNVTFYDTDSQTWHWQQASASEDDGMPNPRSSHCGVGVQSPHGTYEIYLYGGWNMDGPGRNSLDDFWVLTLPDFHWFKLDVYSPPRMLHPCALVSKSQILYLGGFVGDVDGDFEEDPDSWKQGLGIFDLTILDWSQTFDPDAAAYESPDFVRDWYKDGNFDKIEWSSSKVKDMFSKSTPFKDSPASGDEPLQGSKANIGAIAGGVVGGVAALVVLVGSFFFWRRRRSRRAIQSGSGIQRKHGNLALSPGENWRKPELDGQHSLAATNHHHEHAHDSTMSEIDPRHGLMVANHPQEQHIHHSNEVQLDPTNYLHELPGSNGSHSQTGSPIGGETRIGL